MPPTAPQNPVPIQELALEGLRFGYDHRAVVEGVTFQARAGELLALVGPNGCGKSTLLKLLLGDLTPNAGRITLDGTPLPQWGRLGLARRLALVPQMSGNADDAGMLAGAGFTVQQIVLLARYAAHVEPYAGRPGKFLQALGGLGIFGFETPADEQAARQAMWDADVHHLADRPVDTLSGGERQRVAIARALAQQTPVLLLDEPASALDLYHQLELMAQLRVLVQQQRLALLVTHDLNLALHYATRVLVMDRGRIVADGTPEAVLNPAVLEDVYHVRVHAAHGMLQFERRA